LEPKQEDVPKPKPMKETKKEASSQKPIQKAASEHEEPPAEKTVTKEELAKKIGKAKEEPAKKPDEPRPEKPVDKKQKMLADLEYSLRKGLISQKAYETAQKVVMSRKF
jgi:hypothetical protein